MDTDLRLVPRDCSVEKLFPRWKKLFKSAEPLGYARPYGGEHMGRLKIACWGTTLDPCEDNTPRSDGTVDNRYVICLCKWGDGSPITVRYRKEEVKDMQTIVLIQKSKSLRYRLSGNFVETPHTYTFQTEAKCLPR